MRVHETRIAAARGTTFGLALVSAATGLLTAICQRTFFGLPMPAELFGDRVTQLIPLPLFSALLSAFGDNAKHLYFIALLVGEGLLTAAVGAVYWRLRPHLVTRLNSRLGARPSLGEIPVLAVALWLLSAGIFAPIIGAGCFASQLVGGASAVFLAELVPNVVFAVVFVLALRRPTASATVDTVSDAARPTRPTILSRRRLLGQGAVAVAILAGGAVVLKATGALLGLGGSSRRYPLATQNSPDRIVPPPQPTYGAWTSVPGQTPEVTAASDFYYVSKNLASDPSIQKAGWRLQVGGMIEQPYALSYSDLLALPYIERYHTLECISNEVGGNLMSNGFFRGVSLADLLNRAGIKTGASALVFHAADGYSDSLHLSQALDPRSLVVYLLDGQPLPQPHGFPARLLVPGLYGMKNGKWLTSLEVVSGGYEGYWEQQGWSHEAVVKLTSRIDVPADGDVLLARPTFIAGVAFAGDRGIARVDVTVDGGYTWQPATLRQPLGALTWVLWEYRWTPSSGSHILAVRAIDLDGNVQTPREAPTLPDGASGFDAIQVIAR